MPTDFQVADILTKSLSTSRFSMLRTKLNIGLDCNQETDRCQHREKEESTIDKGLRKKKSEVYSSGRSCC